MTYPYYTQCDPTLTLQRLARATCLENDPQFQALVKRLMACVRKLSLNGAKELAVALIEWRGEQRVSGCEPKVI